ncbi:MAG TPA: DUF4145 domain-containing protein [Bryobacteraceae bacterium]|nr:DUF4145 domain-containing protein [Bryobacteraceae bacterium]
MKIVRAENPAQSQPLPLSIRCPFCSHIGTFDPLPGFQDVWTSGQLLGHRRCPNRVCLAHVFTISQAGTVLASYPPALVEFETKDIPAQIVETFKESLLCHANGCYTAAAMMIRKSLEQICLEKGATGSNLKERILDLRSKVILPSALFDAADGLRLLGNDAAHIEAQTYDNVGEEEVELAISLTKEIMKSLYQYQSLLGKLNALRK